MLSKDLLALEQNSENINTKKSTNTWIRAYHNLAAERGKKINMEEYSPSELNKGNPS